MNYAIILAGGIGSRFWPLSRYTQPKQFLHICSHKSMVEESIGKISRLIKKENIYIATNRAYSQKIKNCLKKLDIPLKNILFEPEGKNTLAPIGVLSKKINDIDPEAIVVVFPCDHFVKNTNRFVRLLNDGMEIARQGYIVTLGILPKRPETGYGYIKVKSRIKNFYLIEEFIEKPDLIRVRKFIQDKKYFWNSGVFIFTPNVILGEMRRFIPAVYKIIMKMENKKDVHTFWLRLPSISIDYAVMEKTKKAVLLPVDYGWLDLGSWQVIEEIMKKDKDGNIFIGRHLDIGSRKIIVWSDKRLVATLGLENVIIVDTKDAILVCSKDRTQDVKKVVQILKRKKFLKQI